MWSRITIVCILTKPKKTKVTTARDLAHDSSILADESIYKKNKPFISRPLPAITKVPTDISASNRSNYLSNNVHCGSPAPNSSCVSGYEPIASNDSHEGYEPITPYGSHLYHYPDTEQVRKQAAEKEQLRKNPFAK